MTQDHAKMLNYSYEELLNIFSLSDLQYLVSVYLKIGNIDETSLNNKKALATLLEHSIPRGLNTCELLLKGDLVMTLKGEIYRILALDYIDPKFGKLPLLIDFKTNVKMAYSEPLLKIPELIFASEVQEDLKNRLRHEARDRNYLKLKNTYYPLGKFYISDNEFARFIFSEGIFTFTRVNM